MIKSGVSLRGLQGPIIIGHLIIWNIFQELGKDCVITSGSDSRHMVNSRHYSGSALDYRIRHLTKAEQQYLQKEGNRRLNKDFYFKVKPAKLHAHMEFDPK
jgi:hypothetical protein